MDLQPVQAREMLEQISEQSKNIQQNMSDIVWSIRPDNEKIEDLITRMREYAAQTLEPLNINIKIEADDHLINKILPMQYRKDILLIFKEAINNIAKHANATSVNVQLHNGQKELTLNIVDNGTWKGNNSGTGTKSMKERASKLGGTLSININNGTSIKLNVPLP
jgi:signal transduction histidine kinase